MTLTKKYAIGVHVMFYEIEIYKEYIEGLINLLSTVDNKENVYLDMCFNVSQFLETIDTSVTNKASLIQMFYSITSKLDQFRDAGCKIEVRIQDKDDEFYSQSNYRRQFNEKYCMLADYVMWGETDSLFPKETFQALETLSAYTDSQNIHKYLVCYADRKMWDDSWNPTVHVDYENLKFVDDDSASDNPNYAKSSLSIEKMNEINSKIEDFQFTCMENPKIDGSCLTFTSDLIKCGVNIPMCFIHNDDESISALSKKILGDEFRQYVCKNLLKVHARRHPKKRLYVLNEKNPKGFCGSEKGDRWLKFRKLTGFNINNLTTQAKFFTFKDL